MSIPESKKTIYILELCRAILQLKYFSSFNSWRELYGIVVDFEKYMSKQHLDVKKLRERINRTIIFNQSCLMVV